MKKMPSKSSFKSYLADNSATDKVLPYILNVDSFCIHPSKMSAFLFDFTKKSFVQLDFTTGQQTVIKTEQLTRFQAKTSTSKHIAFYQSSELFILSLLKENDTETIFIVSFCLRDDCFGIVEEYNTEIHGTIGLNIGFLQYEPNQIFYYSYFWDEEDTIVDMQKITINETGKISNFRPSKRVFNGQWNLLFIRSSCCYFLSAAAQSNANVITLLKVQLNNNDRSQNTTELHIRNDIITDIREYKEAGFSQAKVIGDNVFVFLYHRQKEAGQLINLNLRDMCVQHVSVSVEVNRHIASRASSTQSENNFLYLRGQCKSLKSDEDLQAFIYVIDFPEEMMEYHGDNSGHGAGISGTDVQNKKQNYFISTKLLPGIAASNDFCIHPLGKTALIFDDSKKSFVQIDMSTGEQTWFKTKWSKKFKKSRKLRSSHTPVFRSSKPFILSVFEDMTNNIFFASFSFQKNGEIFAVDEHNSVFMGSEKSVINIKQDENGDIFCLSYYYEKSKTVSLTVQISIDENGKISLEGAKRFSMEGGWYIPFICNGYYYWLSLHPDSFLKRLLRIPFGEESTEEIELRNDIIGSSDGLLSLSTQVEVVDERIFIYAYDRMKKRSVLLHFDLAEKCVQKVYVEMEHTIVAPSAKLDHSRDGLLFLSGKCDDESCENKAHICVADFKKQHLENESHEAVDKVICKKSEKQQGVSALAALSNNLEILRQRQATKESYRQAQRERYVEESHSQCAENKAQPSALDEELLRRAKKEVDGYWLGAEKKIGQAQAKSKESNELKGKEPQPIGEKVAAENVDKRAKAPQSGPVIFKKAVNKEKFTPQNYTKQEKLGEGTFGVVYKCFDNDAQRLFVAKETHSTGEKYIQSAKNEIDRLRGIKHPRIIDYYGYKIVEGSSIIIFMEYMAAGSLRQIIDKCDVIKEVSVIKYSGQILEGLAYIHKIGIVHCDLKCDNILHDGFKDPSLNRPPKIDRWSLGCTIVEMLTGTPPYKSMPMSKFIAATVMKTLSYDTDELVPSASTPMKIFLSKLLRYEADNRPRTGEDAIEIFKKLF